MPNLMDPQEFHRVWMELAEQVCRKVYATPEVQEMKKHLAEAGHLTMEEKSAFIGIANAVKYETIFATFGAKGTPGYEAFLKAWQHWFDTKGNIAKVLEERDLTNVEHIVYSSTPSPEEFFKTYNLN